MLPITLHIDELDWALPFLLGLAVFLSLYAAGGILYGKRQGGAAANHTGVHVWKAHPHAPWFVELGGLVLDGYIFTRVNVSGKNGYKPVERAVRRTSSAESDDLESGGNRGKRRSSHMSASSNKSPKSSSKKASSKDKKRKGRDKSKKDGRAAADGSGSKGEGSRSPQEPVAKASEDETGNAGSAGKQTNFWSSCISPTRVL